jgi:anti-sigma B factor antagonist
VLITVADEIDLTTVPQLRGQLTLLAAGGRPVIADLTDVTFIDVAGLRALADAAGKAAASGGSLHVMSGRYQVRRIFALTGLDRQIPLARTRAEALAALPAGRHIHANGKQAQPGPPGLGRDYRPHAQRPHVQVRRWPPDERVPKTCAAARDAARHTRSELACARAAVLLTTLGACEGIPAGDVPAVFHGVLRDLVLAARDLAGPAWLAAADPDIAAFPAPQATPVPPAPAELDEIVSRVLWARFAPPATAATPGQRPAPRPGTI